MVVTNLFPCSIWTKGYESDLDKKYGIKLNEIQNGQVKGLEQVLEVAKKEFPIFVKNPSSIEYDLIFDYKQIRKLLKKHKNVPGFCSMFVKDKNELYEHIKRIYELSYLHYVLGKSENIQKIFSKENIQKFPHFCCDSASVHMNLSLMNKGYSNSSVLGDSLNGCNHYYNGLPFVLEETNEKGFIIVDPTSNQLWWRNPKIDPPKNLIFLANGCHFDYHTDWYNGWNLIPYLYMNLSTLRKLNGDCEVFEDINKYYKEVFENPIRLDIKD